MFLDYGLFLGCIFLASVKRKRTCVKDTSHRSQAARKEFKLVIRKSKRGNKKVFANAKQETTSR